MAGLDPAIQDGLLDASIALLLDGRLGRRP
jgi:hypothetical protein